MRLKSAELVKIFNERIGAVTNAIKERTAELNKKIDESVHKTEATVKVKLDTLNKQIEEVEDDVKSKTQNVISE